MRLLQLELRSEFMASPPVSDSEFSMASMWNLGFMKSPRKEYHTLEAVITELQKVSDITEMEAHTIARVCSEHGITPLMVLKLLLIM